MAGRSLDELLSFHPSKEGFKGFARAERVSCEWGFHPSKEGFKVECSQCGIESPLRVSIPLRKVSRRDRSLSMMHRAAPFPSL